MGWWDEGIMGGDTPLDYKCEFEEQFGALDPFEDDLVPFVKPEPDVSLAYINERLDTFHYPDIFLQVTGYLLMERGAPLNAKLRELILEGIDNEIEEGAEEWGEPEVRVDRLQEFRAAVVAYPDAGKEVEMPRSPGLFEKIATSLSQRLEDK